MSIVDTDDTEMTRVKSHPESAADFTPHTPGAGLMFRCDRAFDISLRKTKALKLMLFCLSGSVPCPFSENDRRERLLPTVKTEGPITC